MGREEDKEEERDGNKRGLGELGARREGEKEEEKGG
jgi:hypothetical protein